MQIEIVVESKWQIVELGTEDAVFDKLLELQAKHWLSRGQSADHSQLVPTIDRGDRFNNMSRQHKLNLERKTIELFRSSARHFSHPTEQGAMTDDIIALMILRHYEVPTRLLDWSMSPYISMYFALSKDDKKDGTLWGFDYYEYRRRGEAKWKEDGIRGQVTYDGSGDKLEFDAKIASFQLEEPNPWICCAFYPSGFVRQNAQNGAYTLSPNFNKPHCTLIADLLEKPEFFERYTIPENLKANVLERLREEYGICEGSIYPDTAGAAMKVAGKAFE